MHFLGHNGTGYGDRRSEQCNQCGIFGLTEGEQRRKFAEQNRTADAEKRRKQNARAGSHKNFPGHVFGGGEGELPTEHNESKRGGHLSKAFHCAIQEGQVFFQGKDRLTEEVFLCKAKRECADSERNADDQGVAQDIGEDLAPWGMFCAGSSVLRLRILYRATDKNSESDDAKNIEKGNGKSLNDGDNTIDGMRSAERVAGERCGKRYADNGKIAAESTLQNHAASASVLCSQYRKDKANTEKQEYDRYTDTE